MTTHTNWVPPRLTVEQRTDALRMLTSTRHDLHELCSFLSLNESGETDDPAYVIGRGISRAVSELDSVIEWCEGRVGDWPRLWPGEAA